MSKIYDKIVKKRGFRELPYQKDFLTNPIYEKPKQPSVLAAGTSSGKTFMAIMKLEIFYSNTANKNKRTLLIPASRTVLRDNVAKELEDFNPSFTYCVATNKAELLQAIKNKCNVIVALPQTIIKNVDSLPKFHNFILDEAHQWYFKPTVQNILNHISPKYQLLLTGTPSRFIAKGDKFLFKYVPVMELYDLKQVTNVKMEVVTSSYDFKQSDYTSAYGNLKDGVKMTTKESDNALMVVCKEMIKKLKNPIKGLHNANRLSKNLFSVFGELDKTIIFCHSKKQADAFYNSLDSFKGLKGKVLISHSENDKDSELFEQFRNDSDIKVLVAVDRGRLGYNMPELFNVVDFTLTQSLDMLLQMYGRLLRLSKTDKQKIYYKVATKNTAPYFISLMTAMFQLTDMEWYSKYNGKNMGGIRIPKVLNNTKRNQKYNNSKSKNKTFKPSVSLADLDIQLDLNLFKQSVLHTNNDEFATIGWTTLGDAYREFFGFKNKWTAEKALSMAKEIKYIDELLKNKALDKALRDFKIRDEAIKHMERRLCNRWSKEMIEEELSKVNFEYHIDLQKYNKSLYRAALNKGMLNHLKLTRNRKQKVISYDLKTNKKIKEFDTLNEAAEHYKTSSAGIRNVCKGKYKQTAGYYFQYKK